MKIGVVAGNFDCIHPGYIHMFKEYQEYCDQLIILLHDDPTIERPEKKKPVLSIQERKDLLHRFVYAQAILTYNTEAELLFLIQSIDPDIRFLGDDYVGKRYTGDELGIPIHWIDRSHGWSTTAFKEAIASSL